MGSYRVISLPGDGIGPEVMEASLAVLRTAVSQSQGLQIEVDSREAGARHYLKTGTTLPEDVLQDCLNADAVLLAAIGLPDVRKPDGTEVQPDMMVGLRRAMDLHSAVRHLGRDRLCHPAGKSGRAVCVVWWRRRGR